MEPKSIIPSLHGVGYVREQATSSRCRRGNQPYGHNPECDCRRASQTVPYAEPVDGVDRDTDAWLEAADIYRDAEFDRQNGFEL